MLWTSCVCTVSADFEVLYCMVMPVIVGMSNNVSIFMALASSWLVGLVTFNVVLARLC